MMDIFLVAFFPQPPDISFQKIHSTLFLALIGLFCFVNLQIKTVFAVSMFLKALFLLVGTLLAQALYI
jgi:hypothetical protein